MSGPDLVAVRGLVNEFASVRVHDGLDLEVHEGEIFSVVGGSGSGKTVLLRTLLGLQRPHGGTVTVMGRNITGGERLPFERVGVVFQHGALWSQLTVGENVAFPITRHARVSARTARELAASKLRMAGLESGDFDKYPAELSGGMTKRAGLARALALDPALLFLDEPTSGLDPVAAAEFDELVEYLHHNLDLTIVMVTHDVSSLYRLSHVVGVLMHGRAFVGTLDEVEQLDDPWISEYFGSARARAAKLAGGTR
jgi:phospholipid/cholesterol/gamma-HCH transport system ATP-binding protein